MKKICLMLIFFISISVMPAFSMKVIVNNTADRRVPSRCSGPVDEFYTDDLSQSGGETPLRYQQVSDYNPDYQMDRYITYYKPLLSRDMRRELIGTTWYYPKYVARYNPEKTYTQPSNNNQTVQSASAYTGDKLNKRFLREAADYYVMDTLSDNPNEAYPAGFEI